MKYIFAIVLILWSCFAVCTIEAKPSIEDYATIEAYVGADEIPVLFERSGINNFFAVAAVEQRLAVDNFADPLG